MADKEKPKDAEANKPEAEGTDAAKLEPVTIRIGRADSKGFSNAIAAAAAEQGFAPKAAPKPDAEAEARAEEGRKAKAEIEAANAELEKVKTELAAERQRVDALERAARATRYAEIAKGWAGDPKFHADMLEHLAVNGGGEDGERFKGYVAQQKAAAEQIRAAALFSEVGSGEPVEGSAAATLEAKIKDVMAADPKLTYQQAYDRVWSSDAKLREQYRAEERVN